MCNRTSLHTTPDEIARLLPNLLLPALTPRYNIAPTQPLLIVRRTGTNPPEAIMARWGLIPPWTASPGESLGLFNARSETAHQKPAFKAAFRERRCLIPVDGFYEWKTAGRSKLPHLFTVADGPVFGLAGLWEPSAVSGAPQESCTILTTQANDLVRPLHDRMPVILEPRQIDLWLDPTVREPERLAPLLEAFPAERMRSRPVNLYLNNSRHEGPRCIEPPEETGTLWTE